MVVLPLGMKRLQYMELPGHVALMALKQDWWTIEHYADLKTTCLLCCDLAQPDDHIKSLAQRGLHMLEDIDNHDVNEIRQVIGTAVQWLAAQPNTKIYKATVARMEKKNEARWLP